MSAEARDTVTLFGAKDPAGRLYLVDCQNLLPAGSGEVTEFRVAPEKVAWAILQVELEEIRMVPVTIQVGGYAYTTPALPGSAGKT
jgi:hypothetical protein